MAGFKFTTNLDADSLYKMAYRRAEEMGFTVLGRGDLSFTATMGSLALSIIVGAFTVYCDFRLKIEEFDDGNELVLERNSPWWTGMIGVSRVKSRAKELMTNIKDEVALRGGKIKREKEF